MMMGGLLRGALRCPVQRRLSKRLSCLTPSAAAGGLVVAFACGGTTVAASAAEAASTAQQTTAPTPSQRQADSSNSSPFVYEQLTEGLAQRVRAQEELMGYMRATQQVVGALQLQLRTGGLGQGEEAVAAYWERMRALKEEVALRTQQILYDVDEPGARARYEEAYGCARWTEPALRAIAGCSPIIEIGAGAGHWQRELSERWGADVLAFDSQAELPLPQAGAPVGDVRVGDEKVLSMHPDRTLFLCYPGVDGMAEACLRRYRGPLLLYVGEGRGGANATDGFFTTLELEWDVVQTIELDPFPECFERLYVLRRRDATKTGS